MAGGRLSGLEALLKAQERKGVAPVERWDPPYCGDIGLKINRDATWAYQGSPIHRPSLVKLFASVLWCDNDGRHYLVTPVEKIVVAVADAPFLAVEMEVRGEGVDQVILLRTNLDDIVRCGADHRLRYAIDVCTGGIKPYVVVRGRLEALLSRALVFDLVEHAVIAQCDGQDMLGLWSDGVFFAMAPAAGLGVLT